MLQAGVLLRRRYLYIKLSSLLALLVKKNKKKITIGKNAKSMSDTESFKWDERQNGGKANFPGQSLGFDIPDKQGTIGKSKTFAINNFSVIKNTAGGAFSVEVSLQIISSPFIQTPTKDFGWILTSISIASSL